MKKKIYLLLFMFMVLIAGAVYNTQTLVSQQIKSSEEIQLIQTSNLALKMIIEFENFEQEIRYLNTIVPFHQFLDERISSPQIINTLKRFYARHQNKLSSLTISDTKTSRYITVNKRGNFFVSDIESQTSNKLASEKVVKAQGKKIELCLPVLESIEHSLLNVKMDIDMERYFRQELEKNYVVDNSWYWALGRSLQVIVHSHNRVKEHSDQMDMSTIQLLEKVKKGSTRHLLLEGESKKVLSSYYPITILGQKYTVAFSVDEAIIVNEIERRTLYIVSFFVIILGITVFVFHGIIKARKKAEKQMEKFKHAIEQSTEMVLITDNEGMIEYINGTYCEVSGYSQSELLRTDVRKLNSDRYSATYYQYLWKIIMSGSIWKDELINQRKDGSYYWEEATISPIINEHNQVTNYIKISADINHKKQVEATLKLNKEKFKLLVDNTDDGVLIIEDNLIQDYNQAAVKMFGVTAGDSFIGRHLRDFAPLTQADGRYSVDVEVYIRGLASSEGFARFEWLAQKVNGDVFYTDVSFTTIKLPEREIFYAFIRDISYLKLIQEELRKAKEKSVIASEAKSVFLANMSHEIRTPMNSILGFTELLENSTIDKKSLQYLKAIKTSGKNLMILINDILDLSKIESGKLEIQSEAISIQALINETEQVFAFKAGEKDISFETSIDSDFPAWIIFDEIRLRQIMFNLVGNAVKFTDNGKIAIMCRLLHADNDKIDLQISVQDTGIGIEESQLEAIFKAFKQREGQSTRKYGGTGLGLSITKRLVEMLGGDIRVESVLDKGSNFIINFYNIKISEEHGHVDIDELAEHWLVKFEHGRVLLIDEMLADRMLISEFLAESPINILQEDNYGLAAENVKLFQPDILIMDCSLHHQNTADVAEFFSYCKEASKCIIVATSVSANLEEMNTLLEMGCDDILQKPFSKKQLFDILKKYLSYIQTEEKIIACKEITDNLSTINEGASEFVANLNQDFWQQWEFVSKTRSVDEIEAFAKSLSQLATCFNVALVSKYADELLDHVNHFDTKSMRESIAAFPTMIENLKKMI